MCNGMLMYIACVCPNLVSVPFCEIPILHLQFPKFLFTCKHFVHFHFQFEVDFTLNDIKVKNVCEITMKQKLVDL